MTFLEALNEAERTGQAFELPYDHETRIGSVSLALSWDREIRHFWESPVAPKGPGSFSGAMIKADQIRSDRWRMRPAPALSNLWVPR